MTPKLRIDRLFHVYLKENSDLNVTIVGHTDGDEAKDLDLSKRRAASVKNMLAAEFGNDAGRVETDGKGESEPADKNDTAAGKANNGRVTSSRNKGNNGARSDAARRRSD